MLPLPFPSAALSCQSEGNPSANAAPTFPTPLKWGLRSQLSAASELPSS